MAPVAGWRQVARESGGSVFSSKRQIAWEDGRSCGSYNTVR